MGSNLGTWERSYFVTDGGCQRALDRAWFSPESCLRKAAMVFRMGETVPGADLGFNSISLAIVQRRDPGGGGQSVRPLQA